jgi:hypothetical protein
VLYITIIENKMASEKIKSTEKKSTIEYMKNEYGMFHTFKLIQGSKRPACKWQEPCNQEKLSICNAKHFNNKYIGTGYERNLGIPTGKKNNLCVIDIDCQKDIKEGKTNIFFEKFGDDPKQWAKMFGCPVVHTPSGGFHLYFQEEVRVPQTQNDQTNIDVRAEGGYIVACGSVVNGKFYEQVAGDFEKIPKMNEDVIVFMEKNHTGSKPKVKKVKVMKDEKTGDEVVVEEICGCDQSLYNYDYTDYMLNNIIDGLDDKYFNVHIHFLVFTTAMKQIDRQDLWLEHCKKRSKHECNDDWMINFWDGVKDGHKKLYAFNHLLNNTEYQKDTIRTTLDYYKYKKTLPNMINADEKIERVKLGINENDEQEDYFEKVFSFDKYTHKKKYFLFKSDTGTGKTTAFRRYMKNKGNWDKGHQFISLVSRTTLGEEQYRTFMKDGLDCGYYEYEDFRNPQMSYICQVDSILKMKWFLKEGLLYDYTLFMDEFNSIIKYIFCSDTLTRSGIRMLVIDTLVEMIKEAKYVIMTDADISDIALNFLYNALGSTGREQIHFIQNTYNHNKGKPAQELFSLENVFEKMKDETEFLVCCDEARNCHLIKDELEQHENKKDKKILVVDRETESKFMSGLDLDEYDIVIFSPKIVYGLDSVRERPVFCVYSEKTIDPKDMVQQINRNRNITKLWFYFSRKSCRDSDFNTFEDCVQDTLDIRDVCNKQDYLKQEINQLHTDFITIFNMFKYNEDCYKTNPSAHFRIIIKERGFKVNTCVFQSNVKQLLKAQKESKEKRIDAVHKDLPFVKEQNEYFGIPDDKITDYAEIFLKSNYLSQFLNCRSYFYNKYGTEYDPETEQWQDDYTGKELLRLIHQKNEMMMKIKDKEEFNIKKIKTSQSKMIFIDKVRRECGVRNRFTIQGFKPMKEEKAKEYLAEYKATFSSKSKSEENPFTTEHGIQKIMCMMYKNVFGCAPFSGKGKKQTIDGKRVNVYTYEDEPCDNWGTMSNIQNYSKLNYVKKIQNKYDAENLAPEYQFDESSDEE